VAHVGLVVLGYLCGSIPTGVLLARLVGVDPRAAGSGNIGATNVARTAGRGLGLLTLLADVAKGALPTALALGSAGPGWIPALAGVAAVVGHCFPLTLGLRGGKGVASALGVLLVLAPAAAGVAVGAFVLVLRRDRRVSVASLAAAAVAAPAAAALGAPRPVVLATLAIAALVAVRHRENVARVRAGTEPRVDALPARKAGNARDSSTP
jgi:glycerol-3-phosphate acyltransferase PlsY